MRLSGVGFLRRSATCCGFGVLGAHIVGHYIQLNDEFFAPGPDPGSEAA